MSEQVQMHRQQQEIQRFLDILETRIQEYADTLYNDSPSKTDHPAGLRFADYVQSRDLSSECWAFSIIIERRIEDYNGPDKETLRKKFNSLTLAIWSTLLDCSLHFLEELSKLQNLPLGSREIFMREIKTLYDTHRLLHDPRFKDQIDDRIEQRMRAAERILEEIIERAPALLDLSG